MEPFSYPNSNHAPAAPATEPAQTAQQSTEQPTAAESRVFAYENSNPPADQTTGQDNTAPKGDGLEAALAARKERQAESFYSAQSMYSDVLPDDPHGSPEQKALAHEFREVFADWRASSQDARELVAAAERLKELPTEATLKGWENEALGELRRTYGADANSALADAQKLVARDPRVAAFLDAFGLGSHPQVVSTLARLARQQKAQGKLK